MDFVSSKSIVKENIMRKKCKDFEKCKETKVCQKRHPKACKCFNSDKGCQFGNECAYKHTESVKSNEYTNGFKKKVEVLETMVIEMDKKLLKLEAELKDIEHVQTQKETRKENKSIIETAHETEKTRWGRPR